jgi:hypothetical protein
MPGPGKEDYSIEKWQNKYKLQNTKYKIIGIREYGIEV